MHEKNCPGEQPIVIGSLAEFDEDINTQEEECPYFIHGGQVYLTVSCPQLPHEAFVFEIHNAIHQAELQVSGRRFLIGGRSTRYQPGLINELGCHALIRKEPDLQYIPSVNIFGALGTSPWLITEIGAGHESEHLLFLEAASWLNKHTMVKYVLAIKIWPSSSNLIVKIYLLGRSELAECTCGDMHIGQGEESSQPCRVVAAPGYPFPRDRKLLEQTYQVKVLEIIEFEGPPGDDIVTELDLSELVQENGFILEGTTMKINWKTPIEYFYQEVYYPWKNGLFPK